VFGKYLRGSRKMLNRCLEKKVSLELNESESFKCNEKMVLAYYLFEIELDNHEEFFGKKAYGIEIVKTINGEFVEKESIKKYSIYKEGALEFLHKLARNTVTPVGLPYLFDDLSVI
jgi:hypothetical protein